LIAFGDKLRCLLRNYSFQQQLILLQSFPPPLIAALYSLCLYSIEKNFFERTLKMMSSSRTRGVAKQAMRRANLNTASTTSKSSSRRSYTTVSRLNRRGLAGTAMRLQGNLLMHQLIRPAYYSTEQILKLRNSKSNKTLYSANDEKENCGVGLIANLKSIPSRHVVEVADEMLVRMAHRGGCGCDPNSGDGAGAYQIIKNNVVAVE
jgi:hypothetical protein